MNEPLTLDQVTNADLRKNLKEIGTRLHAAQQAVFWKEERTPRIEAILIPGNGIRFVVDFPRENGGFADGFVVVLPEAGR